MAMGLQTFDANGKKWLDTADSVGRFVGLHRISPVKLGKQKYTWAHADLLQYGQLFVWMNPDFAYIIEGDLKLTVTNGTIVLETALGSRWANFDPNKHEICVYYGVI